MPLPLLLVGAAVLAGGYGVKKGLDAKSDFDRAGELNAEAKRIYDSASSSLETERERAQKAIAKLGKLKFDIYESRLIPFVDAFSKIKNVDFQDKQLKNEFSLAGVSSEEMLAIRKSALDMKAVVGGGVTALGAGGLAGLAAYGGVGLLGTASTGTAIASLSGAAATNATLAWLGGGALGSGLGVAGGTAVLGGIVAGPVLAVGGMILAAKAEEARHNAYTNREKASAAAEQMKTAETVTRGIRERFNEIHRTLTELDLYFQPLLNGLQAIVATSTDYSAYSIEDRKGVMMAATLAKTLKNVMEAPLLDESGRLTAASRNVLTTANECLQQIESEAEVRHHVETEATNSKVVESAEGGSAQEKSAQALAGGLAALSKVMAKESHTPEAAVEEVPVLAPRPSVGGIHEVMVSWYVEVGQEVDEGEVIALAYIAGETFTLQAPASGTIMYFPNERQLVSGQEVARIYPS